jgi:hypothetical protein
MDTKDMDPVYKNAFDKAIFACASRVTEFMGQELVHLFKFETKYDLECVYKECKRNDGKVILGTRYVYERMSKDGIPNFPKVDFAKNTMFAVICEEDKRVVFNEVPNAMVRVMGRLVAPIAQRTERNDGKICCYTCKKVQKDYKRCSACGFARYCSKECQVKDWPEHKHICKTL